MLAQFIERVVALGEDDELYQSLSRSAWSDEANNNEEFSVPLSILDLYRGIANFGVLHKVEDFVTHAQSYLDDVDSLLSNIVYREATAENIYRGASPTSRTIELSILRNVNLLREHAGFGGFTDPQSYRLAEYVNFRNNAWVELSEYRLLGFGMPSGFNTFAERSANAGLFWDEFLHKIGGYEGEFDENIFEQLGNLDSLPADLGDNEENSSEQSEEEVRARGLLRRLGRLLDEVRVGLMPVQGGARHVDARFLSSNNPVVIYDPDSADPNRFRDETRDVLNDTSNSNFRTFVSDAGGFLADVGDYALVLTYGMHFFSSYSTNRGFNAPARNNGQMQRTPTGVPLSPRMNYFYQAEVEFLLMGNHNAENNLNAVTALILGIRLAMNYITVFKVHSVTVFVKKMWAIPFVGKVIGEIARFTFVMGESLFDTASLRNGYRIPLIKRSTEWVIAPGRQMIQTLNAISNPNPVAESNPNPVAEIPRSRQRGLTYDNYLLAFFLTRAVVGVVNPRDSLEEQSRTLTTRMGDLIELNLIHFRNEFYKYPSDVRVPNLFERILSESIQNSVTALITDRSEEELEELINILNSPNRGQREENMNAYLAREDRFRLSDLATTFTVTTNATMDGIILSQPFARRAFNGIVPPESFQINISTLRGY